MNSLEQQLALLQLAGNAGVNNPNEQIYARGNKPFDALNQITANMQNQENAKNQALLGLQQMFLQNKMNEDLADKQFQREKEMFNFKLKKEQEARNKEYNRLLADSYVPKSQPLKQSFDKTSTKFDSELGKLQTNYDEIVSNAKKDLNSGKIKPDDYKKLLDEAKQNQDDETYRLTEKRKSMTKPVIPTNESTVDRARPKYFDDKSTLGKVGNKIAYIYDDWLSQEGSKEELFNRDLSTKNAYSEPFKDETFMSNMFSWNNTLEKGRAKKSTMNLLHNNPEFREGFEKEYGITNLSDTRSWSYFDLEEYADKYRRAANNKINEGKNIIGEDVAYIPTSKRTFYDVNPIITNILEKYYQSQNKRLSLDNVDVYSSSDGREKFYVDKVNRQYIVFKEGDLENPQVFNF